MSTIFVLFWLFLRNKGCMLNFISVNFWMILIVFLGHVVSKLGVMVDPQNIEAIKNWVRPSSVMKDRSFVGLASFYHRLVKNFSYITTHLTNLMKKRYPLNGL